MRNARQRARVLLGVAGIAMLAAGPVMVVRAVKGRQEIRTELAAQKITFPPGDSLPAGLDAFAGQQVGNGVQARAYADLIKAHLDQATGGRTYSEVSADLAAAGGKDEKEKLSALRQNVFMGESLRASLMSAYQAWHLTSLATGLGVLITGLGATLFTAAQAFAARRD